LRSSSNVELNPIHELAGPSSSQGLNRSQLSIFKSPKDFSSNDFDSAVHVASVKTVAVAAPAKTFNTQQSQSMYLKQQNFDVDKNTIGSQHNTAQKKDFDKRLSKIDFKCFSPISATMTSSTSATMLHQHNQQQQPPPQQQQHNYNSNTTNHHQNINNSNDTLTLHI
jgi:hypothetical protein